MNVTDKLNEDLRPYVAIDANGHLAILVGAVSTMAQPLFDLVGDDDAGNIGYSSLMDINRSRDQDLGWLAQFVGVKLQSGLAAAVQRGRVRSTDGMRRGSLGGIVGAAQQHLTGDQRVVVRERWNAATGLADPMWAQVITYAPETPNPQQVKDDVLSQKPARIQLTFTVAAGQDWEALKTRYGTWQAVRDAYGTWQAVRDDVPG